MNLEKEENTKLFFNELKSNSCNFELLYNLSLKGIYLYKPLYLYKKIRYHEYVVDISLMNNQFFMIYNDKQYNRLIEVFEKYERKNYNNNNKNKYRKLIILNEYIVKKLINDKDNSNTLMFLNEYSNISLYCLLKYNYISYKIFDYFKYDKIYELVFIFMYFYNVYYLKENLNLMNLSKYIGNYYVSSCLKYEFGKDIRALEYIIINVCNNIKDDYCFSQFRVLPIYPIDLLKKVSSKVYKLNILYFKHDDKRIEDLFNNICGDKMLYFLSSRNSIEDMKDAFTPYLVEYKIPENIENFVIVNWDEYRLNKKKIDEYRKNNCHIKEKDLWFGNKDLFNINFELKKYHLKYTDRYDYFYEDICKFSTIFKNNYLNDTELTNILKDPEYIIYKSENDTTIDNNYFYTIIIRCCVIGSLIYNNKSKFIISTLTELLNNYVPLTYNFKENKLRFDPVEREIMYFEDLEEWIEDYNEIFYNTISTTSNEKFNEIFDIKYRW